MDIMEKSYKELFMLGQSSRFVNEGYSGIHYRLPKYAKLFYAAFHGKGIDNILELGAGLGEMYDAITSTGITVGQYMLSEYEEEAVKKLLQRGLSASVIDASDIGLPDNSCDLVCCFDVMHHVDKPNKMASEMLRVSRKWVYLCEANGASLLRKITERTKKAKKYGEKSYMPHAYRKFFGNDCRVRIRPFYFFVPPNLPKNLVPVFKIISEIGERVPLIKWQSVSLEILIEKR